MLRLLAATAADKLAKDAALEAAIAAAAADPTSADLAVCGG